VARLAVSGVPLKCIASELGLSIYTAATYLARVRHKLGQTSRWKLAVHLLGPLASFRELCEAYGKVELAAAAMRVGEAVLIGRSNSEIAAQENLSTGAAAREVARVLKALGLRTRADLIRMALRPASRPKVQR